MKNSENVSDIIEAASIETCQTIQMMENIPGMFDDVAQKWVETCQSIPGQIQSDILKIAVAGAIKSGKSTFINALVGKDIVQRGAGVVTAVTTRIRKADRNRAVIYLKSWDDINMEIMNALLLFPDIETEKINVEPFDIRRQKDRLFLKSIHEKMTGFFANQANGLCPEMILIQNALQGFESCKDVVQADDARLEFSGRRFELHKGYSADLSRAFFVKDICLDVVTREIDGHLEIADCQGSDSTDSGQTIQIQKYLEMSNLIIYLISSRTGLREADIQFLTIIKQMGLLDNILFINNIDLSEHDNLDDLEKVEQDIVKGLKYFMDEPRLFSFSSLYTLFSKIKNRLPSRDKKRLALWQEETKMVDYCQKMNQDFNDHLRSRLEMDRVRLLIANPLERLYLIATAGIKKVRFFSDMLSEDSQKVSAAMERLEQAEENASTLQSIVAQSLLGTTAGMNHKIDSETDLFFSTKTGPLITEIIQFIRNYTFPLDSYREKMVSTGIQGAFYLMFQDFRSELDLFMARQIQPQLSGFVNKLEQQMASSFQSILNSSQREFNRTFGDDQKTGDTDIYQNAYRLNKIDLAGIKKILGLAIPVLRINFRYNAKIQVTALTGFGFQTILHAVSVLFKRQNPIEVHSGLTHAAESIKRQSLKLLPAQMNLYKIQLKSEFFSPLINAVTRDIRDKIAHGHHLFDDRTQRMEEGHMEKKVLNKEQHDYLSTIIRKLEAVLLKIGGLSSQL